MTDPARLRRVVADALRVRESALTDESGPGNPAAWDSLGHILVCLAVEKALGVRLTEQEMREITSMTALRAVMQQARR